MTWFRSTLPKKLTKAVHTLHEGKRRVQGELAQWKKRCKEAEAEVARWKNLLDEQASLNCTLVSQNTRLIERNLVLGDTPTPYSWEPKWCVHVSMSEPLPRAEAEKKAEELRAQGQHAGITVDWEGRKV